jgi:hypothetical protein
MVFSGRNDFCLICVSAITYLPLLSYAHYSYFVRLIVVKYKNMRRKTISDPDDKKTYAKAFWRRFPSKIVLAKKRTKVILHASFKALRHQQFNVGILLNDKYLKLAVNDHPAVNVVCHP